MASIDQVSHSMGTSLLSSIGVTWDGLLGATPVDRSYFRVEEVEARGANL